MSHRIQFRRDTKSRWAEINPVLMEGEVGLEVDTQNIKMGDGSTAWNDLEYGVGYSNVTNDPGNNENLVISQKGVTELVKGVKEGMSAYEYPTIKITDFSDGVTTTGTERNTEIINNMNTWLNGVTFGRDSKLIGHCKIYCDGRNGDVYNYVFSYSNNAGVQVLIGGFYVKSDGTIEYCNGYKTLCRTCSGGTWGEWSDEISYLQDEINTINGTDFILTPNVVSGYWTHALEEASQSSYVRTSIDISNYIGCSLLLDNAGDSGAYSGLIDKNGNIIYVGQGSNISIPIPSNAKTLRWCAKGTSLSGKIINRKNLAASEIADIEKIVSYFGTKNNLLSSPIVNSYFTGSLSSGVLTGYSAYSVDVSKLIGKELIILCCSDSGAYCGFVLQDGSIKTWQQNTTKKVEVPENAVTLKISNNNSKLALVECYYISSYLDNAIQEINNKIDEFVPHEIDILSGEEKGYYWVVGGLSDGNHPNYSRFSIDVSSLTGVEITVYACSDQSSRSGFVLQDGSTKEWTQNGTHKVEVPENAVTLKISNNNSKIADVVCTYIGGGYSDDVTEIKAELKALQSDSVTFNTLVPMKLNGVKWIAGGDSITQGSNGGTSYVPYVASALNITNYVNKGIGGANFSYSSSQIGSTEDEAIITQFAGTNDFGGNTELGSIDDCGVSSTTFYGVVYSAINKIKNDNPNCRLYIITPIKRFDKNENDNKNTLSEYVTAILEICSKTNTPCLDLYNLSTIALDNIDVNMLTDKVHLTESGAKIITKIIAYFISMCELTYRISK